MDKSPKTIRLNDFKTIALSSRFYSISIHYEVY